jgi:hypothetical protein
MIFNDSRTSKPVISLNMVHAGLGDLMMATGAIGAFSDRFPNVLFDVYTLHSPEVFWNLPFIRYLRRPAPGLPAIHMMPMTLPGDRQDGTLHNFYTSLHVEDVPISERRMRYVHAPEDLTAAKGRLLTAGWKGQPLIGVQWEGGKESKKWEHTVAFCRLLVKHGYFVVITSTRYLPIYEPGIAVMFEFYNSREIASVQTYMRCYVGLDSGPTFLAAAIGIPTLWLFSATFPHWLIPKAGANAAYRILWANWHHQCLLKHGVNCRLTDEPGVMAEGRFCPLRMGQPGADCLDTFTPERVYEEMCLLLEESDDKKKISVPDSAR